MTLSNQVDWIVLSRIEIENDPGPGLRVACGPFKTFDEAEKWREENCGPNSDSCVVELKPWT